MDLEELKNTLELAKTLPPEQDLKMTLQVEDRLLRDHYRAVSNLEPMDDA